MLRRLFASRAAQTRRRPNRLKIESLEPREVPAFIPGDIVVLRIGDGSAALTSAATAEFLDEYSPSGNLDLSITLPTTGSGLAMPITASGTATSEGALSRSADGRYLVAVGYGAAPGTASVASSSVPRVIGRIAANLTIDTTTSTSSFSGNNIRSAASVDGSGFWAAGANTGIVFLPFGNNSAGTIVASNNVNNRVVNVFDGQLYATSGSGTNTFKGVNAVGTGTPTSTGSSLTRLPGLTDTTNPSDYSFFLADLNPAVPGDDTLYIGDDSAGITKFSLVGGNWVENNAIGTGSDGYRGLTGAVVGNTVTLYATRQGNTSPGLYSIVDTTGYNQNMTASPTLLVSQPANQAFRGVAFAPGNVSPVNTLPATFSGTEDTTAALAGISTGDADARSANVQVTFSVGSGTLNLNTSVANGVTSSQVSGNGTGTVVITAPVLTINTTLADSAGLTYTPLANANGNVTLTMTTDDLGNTGGSSTPDTDSATIVIAAVNDPPVNSVPGAQNGTEDTPIAFSAANSNAITVSDVDDGGGNEKVTLSVDHGTLTLGSTNNLTVTGNGSAGVTLTGKITDLNTGMAGLMYTPAANYNGSDTLTVLTDDQGNTGSGGPQTDTDTVAINLSAVNDPPVNNLPSGYSATEDISKVLAGISVSDVDAGSADINVSLSVNNGTLTVATGVSGGVNSGQVSGNGSGAVVITAPLSAINATLADAAGLTYLGASNYFGSDTLTMLTNDQGNSGSGGALTDTDTSAITIAPVADTPSVTNATTNEDTQSTAGLVINRNSADGNEVGFFQITAIANGKLYQHDGTTQVNNGDFISFAIGNAGLKFTPSQDFNGTASFGIQASLTNDASGLGGSVVTAQVTVNPVNDPPVNTLPSSYSATEDTAKVLSGISVSDVDAGTANITVTLSIPSGNGTLTVDTGVSGGVTGGQVSGNGTNLVVLTAPLAAIDATLASSAGLTYMPAHDLNGNVTLTMLSNDLGNTGAGGALTDTDTSTISIAAVNDAPVNSVPGTQNGTEDTPVTFSASNSNAITVSDVDDGGGNEKITLSVGNGVLNLGSTDNLSVSGNGSATVILTGTISALNTGMAGLKYSPSANYNGSDTLTVLTDDQGNTGSGGAQTDSDTVTINLSAVNDAPVNTLPSNFSATEDTPQVLTGISVSDLDAGSSAIQVTFSIPAGNGTLTVATGVSGGVTGGDVVGNGTNSVVLTAPLAAINATLADASGLTYMPAANLNGAVILTMLTDDLGNTGSGGPLTDTDTATINIAPVNDPPTVSVPGDQVTAEDTPLVFQLANGNPITVADVDAGNGLKVTLTAQNGTLTLSTENNLTVTGDGTATVVAIGSPGDLNLALSGLTYEPDANYNGSDLIKVAADDQGNTGAGGDQSTFMNISTNVTPVNDAPVNVGPVAPNVVPATEDTPFAFTGDFLFVVNDVDAGNGDLATALTATHGTMTVTDGTGATVTGNGTAQITVTGPLDELNASLAGLTYMPDSNYNGPAEIDVSTNDLGNTGAGGPRTTTDTFAINIASVNDAPVLGDYSFPLNGTVTVGEVVGTVTATDVDGDTISYSITGGDPGGNFAIDPSSGQITIASTAGLPETATLTVTATDNGTDNGVPHPLSDTGTVTVNHNTAPTTGGIPGQQVFEDAPTLTLDLTPYFSDAEQSASTLGYAITGNTNPGLFQATGVEGTSLQLTPASDANGSADITVQATDAGGLTVSTTFTMTVSPVNDAPSFTAGGNQTVAEDAGPQTVNGWAKNMSAGPADEAGQALSFEVTTDNDAMFSALPTIDPTTGTLTYTSAPNANGTATVTVKLHDNGGTANGGVDTSAGQTFTIFVAPVNDAPVVDTSFTPLLPAIKLPIKKGTFPAGGLVSTLTAHVSDVDFGDPKGIAITSVETAAGTWQYTLDGTNWQAIPTVDAANALLLPADGLAQVRLLPGTKFKNQYADLTYKAWDQSAGLAGTQVDTTNLTNTSISLQTEYGWMAVGNAKPVLDAAGHPNLTPKTPLRTNKTSAAFTVKKFLGLIAKETDPTKTFGIAISADSGGNWQFNTGKGGWQSIGAVSDGSALQLRPTDKVRLVPTANFAGVATLTYHTWDLATGTAGSKADTAGGGFSSATESAVLTIDDAPKVNAKVHPALGSVSAGGTTAATAVSAFLTGAATDVNGGQSLGIQLTPASAKVGTWQYSTDGGTTWLDVTQATLLNATAQIRFKAATGAKPGKYSVSFKVWDGFTLSVATGKATLTIA
jgi:hypothetical protein